MDLGRRDFLKAGLTVAGATALRTSVLDRVFGAPVQPGPSPYGPLQSPDANGLMLPAGFSSRVIARCGLPVEGTSYPWPIWPDGSGTFATPDGGWILVVNSETPVGADLPLPVDQRLGGASAIRFDRDGMIVDAYQVLAETRTNCAGGKTPWGTWLSCEEFDESIRGGEPANAGKVWECDPTGVRAPISRDALGSFKHEAAAVDPRTNQVYLTEDVPDGRFYRFTPSRFRRRPSDLDSGILEAAKLAGPPKGAWRVTWHRISDPSATTKPTRLQAPQSTPFDGGEGCYYSSGYVYFTTKGDNRVWRYNIRRKYVAIVYDPTDPPNAQDRILAGVDNVVISRSKDVFVAEDGDNMEIILITPNNRLSPMVRATGPEHGFLDNPLPSPLGSIPLKSEVTGLSFSPDGSRLYFNSQRYLGVGISYEVKGPFRKTA